MNSILSSNYYTISVINLDPIEYDFRRSFRFRRGFDFRRGFNFRCGFDQRRFDFRRGTCGPPYLSY